MLSLEKIFIMKEYIEYHDEKSHKFWEITVTGSAHTVRYGKVDAKGVSQTKEFASEAEALKSAQKLIASKKKKGYKTPEKSDETKPAETTTELELPKDVASGETIQIKGSGSSVYTIKNVGGVYSCSCPAWRNQSKPIDLRTCKHIIKLRGETAEKERIKSGDNLVFVKKTAKTDGPPVLLAHNWEEGIDVTGWWISEKLDGVRAYWDGRKFISRQGNEFYAPDWFVEGMPDFPLDGELWAGRKQFQETVSIVRRYDAGKEWENIKYFIFDAPDKTSTFEQRLQKIDNYFKSNDAPHTKVLEQWVCKGTAHLNEELEKVVAINGEGVMLRQPNSIYEVGRSNTLLKLKRFYDAEAEVIGHTAGKGRHKGVMGSLKVITPEGTEFSVGTGFSDAQRKVPPKIGSIITYRYQELTKAKVPRFPSFVRQRTDVK